MKENFIVQKLQEFKFGGFTDEDWVILDGKDKVYLKDLQWFWFRGSRAAFYKGFLFELI
jgi:hypothetical protein